MLTKIWIVKLNQNIINHHSFHIIIKIYKVHRINKSQIINNNIWILVLFNVITLFIISHECDIITKTLLFYLLAINWMILGYSILFSELTVFILLRLRSKSRLWGLSGECVMCRNTHLWYMPIAIAEQLCQMGLQIIDDGFQSRISRTQSGPQNLPPEIAV